MRHDQLFKTLLEAFLPDFLTLFFPKDAKHLDFSEVRFLKSEPFERYPDWSVSEADVVAEVATREGEPERILVHIGIQDKPDPDFGRHMTDFYLLLRSQYRTPILPRAVYLSGGRDGFAKEEYRTTSLGYEQMRLRYSSVALAHLEAEKYVGTSPFGAAVASLMNKTAATDPLDLWSTILRQILGSDLDDERKFLLLNVLKTYFELTDEQAVRIRDRLSKKEYEAMQGVKLT